MRANNRIVSNDVIPAQALGRQLKGFILRINLYNKVDHGPNNSGYTGRGGVYPRPRGTVGAKVNPVKGLYWFCESLMGGDKPCPYIVMVVFLKLTPVREGWNPESV